jgi:nicotinamide phosphoribosyltransferase
MMDFITCTDGYKLDHRRQYPPGTSRIFANFTARSSRISGLDSAVFFGLQYFLKRYLIDFANNTFFERNWVDVAGEYERMVWKYLGPNSIGLDHLRELHRFGKIPLVFYALPEGTHVPFRVPMFTYENTRPDFFWVTNYIETLMSSVLWMGCTSATTAHRYRKILDNYAFATASDPSFVDWQGHDFSFRGHSSPESAAVSGAGHLLSFTGSDTIPAIQLLEDHYQAYYDVVGGTVPATEHSVMCAGGVNGELATFSRLLDLYPHGIVSVVSDTWDLWYVLGNILPCLHERIMARNGKLVIRPDSGDPVLILTGDRSEKPGTLAHKGVIECLWDEFGGTTNHKGFKELDSHVGAIYGDSITEERADKICQRLMEKGFASTNVVLGIGSYTYQYVTRDTLGFAVKSTWAKVDGQERFLMKDPITDDGTKRSATGRIAVVKDEGKLKLVDKLSLDEWTGYPGNLLTPVWEDGRFLQHANLRDIRSRVRGAKDREEKVSA